MNKSKSKSRKQNPAKNASKRVVKTVAKVLKASKPKRIKGKGDYKTLGGKIGSQLGGALGNLAHGTISKILGFGDYRVRAQQMNMGDSPPSFTGGSEPVICHREFLGILSSGGTNFTLQKYELNPSQFETFPWLCGIARNYQQYTLIGAVVEFKTNSTPFTNVNSGPVGSVIISTQYDVQAADFSTRRQMENYEFTTSCAPYENMLHPIECDRRQTPLVNRYIKTGSLSGLTDPQFYDWGVVNVATDGLASAAGTEIGELWISYKVKLSKPCMPASATPITSVFAGWYKGFALQPLLNKQITGGFGALPIIVGNGTSTSYLQFPENGDYFIQLSTFRGVSGWGTSDAILATPQTGVAFNTDWFTTSTIDQPGLMATESNGGAFLSGPSITCVVTVSNHNTGLLVFGSSSLIACDTYLTVVAMPNAKSSVVSVSKVLDDYLHNYPALLDSIGRLQAQIDVLERKQDCESPNSVIIGHSLTPETYQTRESLSESTLLARALSKLTPRT